MFGLLDDLSKRRLLTPAQREAIASALHDEYTVGRETDNLWTELNTVKESTRKLLLLTRRMSPANYRQFIKALNNSHQQHLVDVITRHNRELFKSSSKETFGLVHQDILDRICIHYDDLVELLDTELGVVDDMLAVNCISQYHVKYIKSATSSKLQNKRLLEVLCRRSQSDFNSALSCLRSKQSIICPLFTEPAVVAKLSTTILRYDTAIGSADKMIRPSNSQLLNEVDKSLQWLALRQESDHLMIYIICQSLDAVKSLDGFAAAGNVTDLLSEAATSFISSSTEVKSIYWPVVDYNRCLHVFYSSEGLYKRIYDSYRFRGRQKYFNDLTVYKYLGKSRVSQMDKCSDELLEVLLQKAVTMTFKWHMTVTAEADVISVLTIHMVCRRWREMLINRQHYRQVLRQTMNALCRPYKLRPQRRIVQLPELPEEFKGDEDLDEVFGATLLKDKLYVGRRVRSNNERGVLLYSTPSSSPGSVRAVTNLSPDVLYPTDLVSCGDTGRLYIADIGRKCVWLIDCSTTDDQFLKPVKFVEIEDCGRMKLSVTSQQLLVTTRAISDKTLVAAVSLFLYDVDGNLLRCVRLSSDDIKCNVAHAVQTTRGTFYVCGRCWPADSEFDYASIGKVLEIDTEGHVLRSYEVDRELYHIPNYLQQDVDGRVFVASSSSCDVFLLDSKLKLERVFNFSSTFVEKLHYCRQTAQLTVVSWGRHKRNLSSRRLSYENSRELIIMIGPII